MAEIVVKFGDKVIEKFVTEKERISIGRSSENDIVLDNKAVSRKHTIVEFKSDTAIVIDNESLNGTFVNNRKVSEEILNQNDVITIGKFDLEFHPHVASQSLVPEEDGLEGTMVLQTKRQKELIEKDREDRKIAAEYGGPLLVDESTGDDSKYLLDGILTIGKSKLATIQAKGFLLSNLQAKIIPDGDRHMVVNIGKKGKVKINGEDSEKQILKNGDIIKVGKSTYRYLQAQ
ncbi:MAG: FHA domain-containing protein [candidate division Zixibacteria bacterium]|nr:FHA domain-containing protein [candidate division Zixibacteria bacterium]